MTLLVLDARPRPSHALSRWNIAALANHFLWASGVLSESTTGKPGPDASVLAPGMGASADLVGTDVVGGRDCGGRPDNRPVKQAEKAWAAAEGHW